MGDGPLATFKFLHAADIHLDSPLRGLSRYEGVPADDVRLATRTALDNLVEAAIEEEIAFVVIAGDLYDGDWPDFGTGLVFCAAMGRLEKAGIDVFLLYGNHDAESNLTKKLPLPENVKSFGTRKAATFVHDPTGAALHGWSYRERDTRDNLAIAYPPAVPNCFNIGVLHTALTGRPPHAPYAPCTTQELAAKGYDYWALGHVHAFEIVSESPYIVYPGNLQGRNIRETGPKGAVLVSVVDDRIVGAPLPLALDAVRWAAAGVDVAGAENEADIHGRIGQALSRAFAAAADGRPLMVRLIMRGATPFHGGLIRRRGTLREEVRAIALAVSDRLWIEKIELATSPLASAQSVDATTQDELSGLLAEGVQNAELATTLKREFADFLAQTPPDLGAEDALFTGLRDGDLASVIEDASAALDARIAGGAA